MLAVREDILGVYKYEIESQNGLFFDDRQVNRASIRLYWAVLGLVSQWMGCRVEDLTLVVLVHELAHAYTQLGADIEGRRWPPVAFTKADIEVKEGLAQYYTDRVLQRLKRRYPESFTVYKQMLSRQPKAYRTHLEWINNSTPEAVRRAMLETRRRQEGKLSDFNRRLADAQQQLKPLAQS